ncbi:S1 family peptidase, partial [Streptomyces albus]|uniref:S1 family peptidase n=1 Tax=Streptomyces albus TaxID=1888 RepID=UPI00131BE9D2
MGLRGMLGRPTSAVLATITAVAAVTAWGVGPMAQVSWAEPGDGLDTLVEDFAYPDRDKLLAEKGLKLISGDGNIQVADCATGGDDLVRINSRASGNICFAVSGPVGYLTMEIERTYLAKSDARDDVMATVRTEDPRTNESKVEEVDLDPGSWKALGEGIDPELQSTLLELSVGEDKPGAVLGGDAARPWLARVTIGKPGYAGGRNCSGALVDRTWVLTAASCFTEDPAKPVPAGAPARDTTASFAGKAPIRINHLVPREDRDVVLARLSAPVAGIEPAALAATAPAGGAALVAAGYGRTGSAWVPGTPHSSGVTQAATTATGVKLTGGRICKGDAGGPVLDANGLISGVQSRADHTGCLGQSGQGTGAVAARVDNIASWLSDSTFTGKARFTLDEGAGSRRVLGGEAEEFAAAVAGGAQFGAVGRK